MNSVEREFQDAVRALQSGRLHEAEPRFRALLKAQPKNVAALNLLTIVLMNTGRHAEAEKVIAKAIRLNQSSDTSYYNYGVILKALDRPRDALTQFDNAIRLNPLVPETWNNRGVVCNDLKQYDDAIRSFDRAVSLAPNYADALHNKGKALSELRRYDEALSAFDRALALQPGLPEAWVGRGNCLGHLMRRDEAMVAYDKALALKPQLAEAWLGRAISLFELKRFADALAACDKALAFKPELTEALPWRGEALRKLGRCDQAIAAYQQALASRPDLAGLKGIWLSTKMRICDWSGFDAACADLVSDRSLETACALPFNLLAIPSSPEQQLKSARGWVAVHVARFGEPLWKGEHYRHDRIRVAYLSSDFHQHATAYLMAGLFECHDRSKLQTIAISCCPDDGSEIRRRLQSSFDSFVEAADKGDDEIAALVRAMEVDILVDLKGFTEDARTNVFARRPAPIQVSFLGYPGTMGAAFMDYIIADRVVIPEDQYPYYDERVVSLPNSYQPNDARRAIADTSFSRGDLGLPPQGFVFCCFNSTAKILPQTFDCWMRILKQVDGSVLWLLTDNDTAAANLRKEAAARGVDAGRLVFAPFMAVQDHLARLRAADLVLDTLPYNAHTTASDALWAGVPVLTCLGSTFAGRVAASLLHAADLPELVTTSMDDYERLAVELATAPGRIGDIRRRLNDNRLTAPLFNTELFARHLEAAYSAMHQRLQSGLPPDHIAVQG